MQERKRAEAEAIHRSADQGAPQDLEQPSLLDQVAASTRQAAALSAPLAVPLVGECVDDTHPVLMGRARVRFTHDRDRTEEQWLPCLHGVTVRKGDRVMLQQPANYAEPLVVGVMDGFTQRPETPRKQGPTVPLRVDESVRVRGESGEDLLEIFQEEGGPVVRLLDPNLCLDLPGDLRIRAASIRLDAKQGGVEINASDDVDIQGEMINLN